MIPKGTLLIIGGAEDKVDSITLAMERKNIDFKHFALLNLLLTGRKKVEIITTTSMYQEEMQDRYQRTFDKIGLKNTGFIPIVNKDEAGLNEYIKRMSFFLPLIPVTSTTKRFLCSLDVALLWTLILVL